METYSALAVINKPSFGSPTCRPHIYTCARCAKERTDAGLWATALAILQLSQAGRVSEAREHMPDQSGRGVCGRAELRATTILSDLTWSR